METGIEKKISSHWYCLILKRAREGLNVLDTSLETAGTYESNGIAISDVNEIWWLESIGDITDGSPRTR